MKPIVLMICLTAALVACSERDQSLATSAKKPDTKPWQAAQTPYTAKGWTAGDKANWETQIRTRGQTQNEYVKVE